MFDVGFHRNSEVPGHLLSKCLFTLQPTWPRVKKKYSFGLCSAIRWLASVQNTPLTSHNVPCLKLNTFLDLARNELLKRMMPLKISEGEAYQTAEMTSWYYYLALKSEVLCLCHYKLSKACYVSQIVYNPFKLSPAYGGVRKKKS